MDPRKNRRVSLNLVAGLLLLVSAVLDVVLIRGGSNAAWYIADLAFKVFMAIMLIKRNRSWIYVIPLIVLSVVIVLTRTAAITRWGGCVAGLLMVLLVLALATDKLPPFRPLAQTLWFVPGAIGLICYLFYWVGANGTGTHTAGNLILALLMNALPPVSYILMGKWLAEEES